MVSKICLQEHSGLIVYTEINFIYSYIKTYGYRKAKFTL